MKIEVSTKRFALYFVSKSSFTTEPDNPEPFSTPQCADLTIAEYNGNELEFDAKGFGFRGGQREN